MTRSKEKRAEYQRKWRQENKEKRAEYNRRYYQKNKAKRAETASTATGWIKRNWRRIWSGPKI
tara:strand:- start:14985 stop:15173 length:189 start_codon:yes stop_codon:yes gene_type:complete